MATSVGTIKVNATLDSGKFTSGLNDMEASADKATNKFGGKFADLAKKALKAGAVAGAALVTGAVKSFSDNQQLVGGVNKLFGSAADDVVKNAQSAFRRTQMSANDYLNTVTGFSASLIAGLHGNTAKAAKIADTAVTDMADNANTFGTSMSSIQYAYQGFAKQNYTMLDNLKLGYGGTASEMARLVNDSGVMGDTFQATAKNINSVSFDKIIEAIHVTQERMQIAGTSSKEAGGTIEGSFNQMKSAAQNFLTALGGGGNAQQAFKQLIDATKQFGENLKPVIREILNNVGAIIDEYIPGFTSDVKQVFDFIKNNKQLVIAAITSIGLALVTIRIGTFLGDLSESIGNIKAVAKGAGGAIKFIWSGNGKGFAGLLGVCKKLAPLLGTVGSGVASIATTIGGALVTAIQAVGSALGTVGAFLAANPVVLIIGAIVAVVVALVALYNKSAEFRELVNGIVSAVVGFIQGAIATVVSLFQGMWKKLTSIIGGIVGFVQGVWGAVVGIISGIPGWINGNVIKPVVGFISGLWNGIKQGVGAVANFISSTFAGTVNWIKMNVIDRVGGFFSWLWNGVKQGVGAVANSISSTFGGIVNWIKMNVINRVAGYFRGLWNGVASGLRAIGGGIRSAMWSVVGFIKAPINAIIGGVNAVLSRINGIKVPDWVPKIGGSHTNFGHIPMLATGGYVDGVGTGTSDSNPALLSRGEYVVKASTVRDFGVDFFDRLNAGQLPTSAGSGTMVTNNYYQFDQQANNRWMYEQIRTGAAA